MVTVKKLNVVLDVADESLGKYLKLGYNQVDPATGDVIKEAVPNDLHTLRLAYIQNQKTISELQDKITSLVAEVEKLSAKPKKKKSTKTEETQPEE